MTTPTASPALSPLDLTSYFRDHAPAPARCGSRGYLLRILMDMARLKGPEWGTCFPSVSYLAERIGRSVRHVRRCLAELEALDEIKRTYRKGADGGWSSSLYELRGLRRWVENVRRGTDARGRKTPTGNNSNPARGVKSGFRKKQTAPPRAFAPTAPVDASGQAVEKKTADGASCPQRLCAALSAPSPAKWRGLTAAQVAEARDKCNPVQWQRLQLAAGLDGVTGADLDAAAAHRWRAGAIMRGEL